ncbi:menaquinone-dependent protoporphyrinogen IX dehydrogenase [Lampropedia puyangensis]|uniref:Protoporphyrinogen IX dehydrogenase [quinone] n=1 Tax=Lampropedia puyangensis TaxID=1330072 RepID=A0A4S8FEL0_9BURK|nr:menaquinone-dependent protoporphyrinogen IX dehydrogenase [Lampropedia puyangensis]THU05481.1 menaquinone-dependent protoporphyrinogen IX dehydrogenase [Lampropedia puyangensis]
MPSTIAILHASRFGQAEKIAHVVAAELSARGFSAPVTSLAAALSSQEEGHHPIPAWATSKGKVAGVVLIASIRYGHFAPELESFIEANKTWLANVPTAFASVSLTARKPEKNTPQTHPYTRRFLQRMHRRGWHPETVAVFAGALRYPRYGWLDKAMIRLIMRITGGETNPSTNSEYTDWKAVRCWAHAIAAQAGL